MTEFLFPPSTPSLPVLGEKARFPIRRVWCVGSNYRKPGKDYAERESPYFFSKQPDMCAAREVPHGGKGELRFEVELVVAMGRTGSNIGESAAGDFIFGHAVGLDMTRRDLLLPAQEKGKPWEIGKSFDASAPVGAVTPGAALSRMARIGLSQNGVVRQDSSIDQMIWTIPEIIARLSRLVILAPGDLIFTGTPAGHGPCLPGDRVEAAIQGLEPLRVLVT